MHHLLQLFLAVTALVSAGSLVYVLWCLHLRPRLPWERQAQNLAAWMRDVFGKKAEEEARDRAERAMGRGAGAEWRQWRRVGDYLEGRR